MKKIMSRKFFAFIIWAVLIALAIIFNPEMNEKTVEWFGRVTLLYMLGQSAVDAVAKWKGKNE